MSDGQYRGEIILDQTLNFVVKSRYIMTIKARVSFFFLYASIRRTLVALYSNIAMNEYNLMSEFSISFNCYVTISVQRYKCT